MTGIAVGLAVSAWLTTQAREPGPRKLVRGVFSGIGVAVLLTHLLQRMDESGDSRRSYRLAKTRYMEALAASISNSGKEITSDRESEIGGGDSLDWLKDVPDTSIHSRDSLFEDEPSAGSAKSDPEIEIPPAPEIPLDPRVAFDSAMADGSWNAAFDALLRGREANSEFEPGPDDQIKLRKSAMEAIFQRMHSGTVREDVAQLAEAVVSVFPESTEGRTLAQVLGVLRRSAGLCPRCSRPYRGIASACHDCLRGTNEAYQIAWDDDSGETGSAD
ncbi:hypothetical protein GC170_07520 [bacterium]|nr:hypothetical protein [bacterium]